ncbi:MAG: hypothetical protein JWN78_224 [Bacteroidota bacterium]|nr:hypothetical protein [Bacteroidota bacterium]
MKQAFILIYDYISDKKAEVELLETITNNFVSKKAKSNCYVIVGEKDQTPKEIYDIIAPKISDHISLTVFELGLFYGKVQNDLPDWMKEKFPDWEYF